MRGVPRPRRAIARVAASSIGSAVFAFSLIALHYLVVEELLVEAHTEPESPLITALFFAGFLLLLVLEETVP